MAVAKRQQVNRIRIFAGSACHLEAGIPVGPKLLCVTIWLLPGPFARARQAKSLPEDASPSQTPVDEAVQQAPLLMLL